MGEGVSLPQSGVPGASHRSSGSLVISVPFSREHSFYGKIILPDNHGFSGSFSVSSGGSYLPEVRMAIGAGAWIHKWSNVDIESFLSADLLETDLSGVFPNRSMGEGRLLLPILGYAFVELVLPTIRANLVGTELTRARLNPGGCFSWGSDLDLKSLLTLSLLTVSLEMLSAGYESCYQEPFDSCRVGRLLGSLGCVSASANLGKGTKPDSSVAGKAWSANVAGSGDVKNGPARAWVLGLGYPRRLGQILFPVGPELGSSDPEYGGNGGRLGRGKSSALETEPSRVACVQKLHSNGFSFSDPVCPLNVERLECGRGEQSGGSPPENGIWGPVYAIRNEHLCRQLWVSPAVSILMNGFPFGCRTKWVLITGFSVNPGGIHSVPTPSPTKGSLSNSGYPDSLYGFIGGRSSVVVQDDVLVWKVSPSVSIRTGFLMVGFRLKRSSSLGSDKLV